MFSARVWQNALILLIGAILCRKERTVAGILRIMGLGNDPHFVNYHRVLSKARWSGLQAAKILLGLLVALVPVDCPVSPSTAITQYSWDSKYVKSAHDTSALATSSALAT